MWFNLYYGSFMEYFQYYQKLFLRSILQSAGFSYSLFPYFKTDSLLVESNRAYIVSSNAIQAAREHFRCADI
jgi:hypothetical protein